MMIDSPRVMDSTGALELPVVAAALAADHDAVVAIGAVIEGETDRQRRIDYAPLLSDGGVPADKPQYCVEPHNRPWDRGELAEQMVADYPDLLDLAREVAALPRLRLARAMGYDDETASCAIRVSLGLQTTEEDVLRFAEAWLEKEKRFRARAA